MTRTDVLVIGCGVIGLTAGVRMREAGLGVRIVTADASPDHVERGRRALVPVQSLSRRPRLSWGSETFEIFEELSHLHESGVRMREGVEIWRHRPRPLVGRGGTSVRRC